MKNLILFSIIALYSISLFGQTAQPTQGGGIYLDSSQANNNVVTGNQATGEGTGIYANSNSIIVNNTVADNRQVREFSGKAGEVYENGVIFYVDYQSRTALVVSLNEVPATANFKFRTYGENGQNIAAAADLNNGKSNTAAIIAAQVIVPDVNADRDNPLAVSVGHSSHFTLPADTVRRAAHYCAALTEGGHADWFLPSREQLKKLYTAKAQVNATFQSINTPTTPLGDGCYLSSSQADAYSAWYVFFDNGETNVSAKSNTANVRAIREVKF
ncbi:MAG: DUF1566 domain-containing protein [Paludibacter sp.]|jgi:hypothetical protein|nr:DUF1566 domain-containing protein [Paludibacter sp.]